MTVEPTAHEWDKMPSIEVLGGYMKRSGFRSDGTLLTFNSIRPGMKRWEPHHHPFDQIVLTVDGIQILEVEGKAFECPPRSIVRIAGDDFHTGWPKGDRQVLNIDVFSPPRADYLFLADWQEGFPARDKSQDVHAYHQTPNASEFSGTWLTDTKDIVYLWDDLPSVNLAGGKLRQAAFRGDDSLLTFNWMAKDLPKSAPVSHPSDVLILVVDGTLSIDMAGKAVEAGPRSITRVPPNTPYAVAPAGGAVLAINVFSPVPAELVKHTLYQAGFEVA